MKLRSSRRKKTNTNWVPLVVGIMILSILTIIFGRISFGYWLRAGDETMGPGLQKGDVRFYYKNARPRRGDITLIRIKRGQTLRRIIGEPGDRIRMVMGQVWINGTPATGRVIESRDTVQSPGHRRALEHVSRENNYVVIIDLKKAQAPAEQIVTVPQGFAYVMCDNRPRCTDNDSSGLIPVNQLNGVLSDSVWP